MIGIQNDGSNISIGTASCNSENALIDEQPRKQPKVVVNGVAITVAEPETHCGTYKKAYIVWGVGTAIGFVASLTCGIPLCAYYTANPGVGVGVSTGVTACGSALASLAAIRVAHKINQEKGFDTTITGGIVDFADSAKTVVRETRESIKAVNPLGKDEK